jgi:hypothetical protein
MINTKLETDCRTLLLPGASRVLKGAVWLASLMALTPLHSQADVVTYFDEIATNTINAAASPTDTTPEEKRPVYFADLATVHVAIYDAVNAIVGGYESYHVTPSSPTSGASVDAAASAAACKVLHGLFPNRGTQYASACAIYLGSIPDGGAKTKGIAVGEEVALKILALRANDGRSTNVIYVPGSDPGDFRPVALPPVNIFLPFMAPFATKSASQFRAEGPPELDTKTYAKDFNEVKALGVAGGAALTIEQRDIARFYTEPPPQFWPRNLRGFAKSSQSVADNARLMAILWVVQADALITCFESKYHYDFWRPRSAIPLADTDGNPATVADPGWTPFVPTPNHPEYPAAHACNGGAVAEVLRQFFGNKKIAFDFDSTVTNTVHHFESTDELVKEEQVARIYGGMHFRTSTVDGKVLGMKVAKWVTKNYFQPIDHEDHDDHDE